MSAMRRSGPARWRAAEGLAWSWGVFMGGVRLGVAARAFWWGRGAPGATGEERLAEVGRRACFLSTTKRLAWAGGFSCSGRLSADPASSILLPSARGGCAGQLGNGRNMCPRRGVGALWAVRAHSRRSWCELFACAGCARLPGAPLAWPGSGLATARRCLKLTALIRAKCSRRSSCGLIPRAARSAFFDEASRCACLHT